MVFNYLLAISNIIALLTLFRKILCSMLFFLEKASQKKLEKLVETITVLFLKFFVLKSNRLGEN